MENIIAKASALYEALQKKNNEVSIQKEKLNKDTQTLLEVKKHVHTEKADIQKREAAISQVEGLIQVQSQAKVAKKEANEARQELSKERDAFDASVKEQKQALALGRQQNEQAALKNSKGFKKLKEDRDALELEKKDLKAQVLKEIGARINA